MTESLKEKYGVYFLNQVSILLEFGKTGILPSNEQLESIRGFDLELMTKLSAYYKPWDKNWEELFSNDEIKIHLLKGLILFEKINSYGFGKVYGSVATNIIVFDEIRRLNLDIPELLDWIFKNRSTNSYTPFGFIMASIWGEFKSYEAYKEHLDTLDEQQMKKFKSFLEGKKLRKIDIQRAHKNLMNLRFIENLNKNAAMTLYFSEQKDLLNDILEDKLPFHINLIPPNKLHNIHKNLKSMSKDDLLKLINKIPNKPKRTSAKLTQIKLDIKNLFKNNLIKTHTDKSIKDLEKKQSKFISNRPKQVHTPLHKRPKINIDVSTK